MSNTQRIIFSLTLLSSACLFGDASIPTAMSTSSNATMNLTNESPLAADMADKKSSNNMNSSDDMNSSKDMNNDCISDAQPYNIELRHIEGRGVGYSKGYTTLQGSFMPGCGKFIPIVDLRGHVFDDGKFAANAGLGFRYVDSRVWGINAFYDYRKVRKTNYNQVSLGLESLGYWVDYRINGYLPVGNKRSNYYNTHFHSFSGNSIILSRKRDFAMGGANAEVGVHMYDKKSLKLYGALGPYYFGGENKNAWGGEVRLAATIFDYVRIQGSTSYDNVFKWIGQGELSINIPLGPKKKVKNPGNQPCSNVSHAMIMQERAVQRIDRDEIIVIDHKRKQSQAINPATGLPYVVVFVDNTSHSLGTFESPYPTLGLAQNNSAANDIIYVFPGDGTTNGMNAGIDLKNFQRLYGSGVAHTIPTTLGEVTIPSMTSTNPQVTNLTASSVVVSVINGNEISGFDFLGPNGQEIISVFGDGTQGCTITNNNFTGANNYVPVVLQFFTQGIHGNVIVSNNTMTITDNSSSHYAINISPDVESTVTGGIFNNTITNFSGGIIISSQNAGSNVENFTISGNTINLSTVSNTSGIRMDLNNLFTNVVIRNNIINAPVGDGIDLPTFADNTTAQIQIIGNLITAAGGGIAANASTAGTNNCFLISGNNLQTGGTGVTVGANPGHACVRLTNNNSPTGYFLTTQGSSGTISLEPTTSNIGTVTVSGNVNNVPSNTCCD